VSEPRYAVYWAPRPDTALAAFGRAWLGRDAETGVATEPPTSDIVTESWRAAIAEPALYGFHATLKPPFRLAAGKSLADLETALVMLAGALTPPSPIRLHLAPVGGFLALVPRTPQPILEALAARCVEALDGFRAPPEDTELERRRVGGLTPRQDALLLRWGYPYVMDEFRFHMTLTRKLAGEERDVFARVLAPLAERACAEPVTVGDLCLFEQCTTGAPFILRRRVPLAVSRRVARSA
jgi:putative phosphonate metabolism protein